jgi:hypothetical protein
MYQRAVLRGEGRIWGGGVAPPGGAKWQDTTGGFGLGRGVSRRSGAAVLTAAGAVLFAAGAAFAVPCGALVCLRAAAGGRGDCAAPARDDFTAARSLCQERDPICAEACAWRREECRTGVGFIQAEDACDERLRQARAKCVVRHPRGSVRRRLCLDRAQLADVRCRARVRRRTRRERRRCDREIVVCVGGCGPGSPPGGSVPCRAAAARMLKGALSACGATARAERSACLDKDGACVEDCSDAQDACTAPIQAALAAAMLACTDQERTDAAACGGDASCTQAAESTAWTCRETARSDAAPGLAACAQQYRQCVRACPAEADATPAPAARERSACTLSGAEALR